MRTRLLHVSLISFIVLLTPALNAQSWNQLLPGGGPPAARGAEGTTAVYDAASDRMIVFGGRSSGGSNLNDVWVLTNANGLGGPSQWLNLIPDGVPGSPPARSGHVAVYDTANNRMIIFGGTGGFRAPAMNDTWVLTNANGLGGPPVWTQLSTPYNPQGRVKPAAIYDQQNNLLIIFGGQDGSASECSVFSDIWFLSSANGLGAEPGWLAGELVFERPPGSSAATAVIAANGSLILFGGTALVNGTCQATNGVWVVTNYTLSQNLVPEGAPGSPPARAFHSAVYDSVAGRMITFGGQGNDTTALNDVWSLSAVGDPIWTKLSSTGPPPSPRFGHAATFDSMNRRMTIFGGTSAGAPLNDTWVLTAPAVSELSCVANFGVPPIIRAEGVTERLSDIYLNCSGGVPTPIGQPIPKYTVTLSLNTSVTNRLLPSAANLSDALLAIDYPFPASPVPSNATPRPSEPPQILCKPHASPCAETGTGGLSNPYSTQPNIFMAQQSGPNSLQWTGVPIDPPGVSSSRVIQITNVRANASLLPLSATWIATAVPALVDISGAQPVPIANPQQAAAAIELAMYLPASSSANLLRCIPHNSSLQGAAGSASFDFSIRLTDGFASSLLRRNWAVTPDGNTPPQLLEQNVFGYPYNTESGLYSPSLFTLNPRVGLADFGSRILVRFNPVSTGTHLFVPVSIPLTAFNQDAYLTPTGELRLVQAGPLGNSAPGFTPVPPTASVGITPVAEISHNGTSADAVYEVVNSDPNVIEVATIPVAVSFMSVPQLPPALGQVFVNTSLAPLSLVETSDAVAPIPRFADISTPQPAYTIQACSASSLSGKITAKTGVQNARVWTIEVDNGATPAHSAQIDGLTFTQTVGAACTPRVTSTFPVPAGDIAAGGSATAPATIDFTGCPDDARFTVNIPLSANGGATVGDILRSNQSR